MNGVGSAMAWQKRGGPAQSKERPAGAVTSSEQKAWREMNSPTPVRGEDAQLSITKVRSDFFARNVRLRA